MEQNKNDNKRRGFLKALLTMGASVGLLSNVKAIDSIVKEEKVKMLTPDGRMVEVNKSVFEKATVSERASNEDVKKWMKNP